MMEEIEGGTDFQLIECNEEISNTGVIISTTVEEFYGYNDLKKNDLFLNLLYIIYLSNFKITIDIETFNYCVDLLYDITDLFYFKENFSFLLEDNFKEYLTRKTGDIGIAIKIKKFESGEKNVNTSIRTY